MKALLETVKNIRAVLEAEDGMDYMQFADAMERWIRVELRPADWDRTGTTLTASWIEVPANSAGSSEFPWTAVFQIRNYGMEIELTNVVLGEVDSLQFDAKDIYGSNPRQSLQQITDQLLARVRTLNADAGIRWQEQAKRMCEALAAALRKTLLGWKLSLKQRRDRYGDTLQDLIWSVIGESPDDGTPRLAGEPQLRLSFYWDMEGTVPVAYLMVDGTALPTNTDAIQAETAVEDVTGKAGERWAASLAPKIVSLLKLPKKEKKA